MYMFNVQCSVKSYEEKRMASWRKQGESWILLRYPSRKGKEDDSLSIYVSLVFNLYLDLDLDFFRSPFGKWTDGRAGMLILMWMR